jgi:hypothetical protein
MLVLQHLLPEGNSPVLPPDHSEKLRELMLYLHPRIAKGWTAIPDTELETFFIFKKEVPTLAFRKHKKEAYVHIFCFESHILTDSLNIVSSLYFKFRLGIPEMPVRPNWIHTVPLPGQNLSQEEILLTYQITQSLFWTVYADFKKHRRKVLRN